MSEFFDYTTGRLAQGTTANATDLNDIFDEISTGLAKLPTEVELKFGTSEYGIEEGVADAYVVTLPYVPSAYIDGMNVVFKASNINTGASTINVNSLGVVDIKRNDGSALSAGDIGEDKIVSLRYNSTSGDFELQNVSVTLGAGGVGTMSLQNANAVSITGGTIADVTVDADTLSVDGVAITATAAEINAVATGITASVAEINSTCDGNTATAAEITAVCDGNTATAAEITSVCDGNTATAAQISEKCNSEAFVNSNGGSPTIITTTLAIDSVVTESAWRSVGPTGGGATITWTALDSVPSGANWIEVRCVIEASDKESLGAANMRVNIHARSAPSTATVSIQTMIAAAGQYIDATTLQSFCTSVAYCKIPISSRKFDLYWESDFVNNDIDLFITGYGYNP